MASSEAIGVFGARVTHVGADEHREAAKRFVIQLSFV